MAPAAQAPLLSLAHYFKATGCVPIDCRGGPENIMHQMADEIRAALRAQGSNLNLDNDDSFRSSSDSDMTGSGAGASIRSAAGGTSKNESAYHDGQTASRARESPGEKDQHDKQARLPALFAPQKK